MDLTNVMWITLNLWLCHNMEKHSQLLFHVGVDAIFQQSPLSEPFDKFKEGASAHLNHLHSLHTVSVVDVVQICYPLSIPGEHRTVLD